MVNIMTFPLSDFSQLSDLSPKKGPKNKNKHFEIFPDLSTPPTKAYPFAAKASKVQGFVKQSSALPRKPLKKDFILNSKFFMWFKIAVTSIDDSKVVR